MAQIPQNNLFFGQALQRVVVVPSTRLFFSKIMEPTGPLSAPTRIRIAAICRVSSMVKNGESTRQVTTVRRGDPMLKKMILLVTLICALKGVSLTAQAAAESA